MKKLLIILGLFISIFASAQIDQKFSAYAKNLDSLATHVGRHLQPITVLGRFSPNDGFASLFYYDSLSTATEIPYQIIKVTGTTNGRWIQMPLVSTGGGDTSIFNSVDFAVINILTVPPVSPTTGDKYLAGVGSAGAWISRDNHIETWNGSLWVDTIPTIGQLLINATNTGVYKYTAGGWIQLVLVLHDNLDDYGNKKLSVGNKRNKGFSIGTNNTDRFYIDSSGRTYIYVTPTGTAGTDSVLVQSGGLIKKIPPNYYSTGGASVTGNYGNLQLNRNSLFATPASDSLSFNSQTLAIKGNASVTNNVTLLGTAASHNASDSMLVRQFSGLIGYQNVPKIYRYNILDYGALKATIVYDGAMTSGSATLTSATAAFVAGDAGKIIVVKRSGAGKDLITTIAGVTNSTTVTLTATASTTVSSARVVFGIDCTTAVQAAMNAADAAGGGTVFVPNGIYIIAGALQTNIGGKNMNSQIYLPINSINSPDRKIITIRGETAPAAGAFGGGLPPDSLTAFPTSGATLYSTLITGAASCAVIGTQTAGGVFPFNESSIIVENLQIMVCNNPAGGGPVVGGISMKNGASLTCTNVNVIIDTSGWFSTFPVNNIAGVETPDNSSEDLNVLTNVLVGGFRSGIKFGEHVDLSHTQTMCCYYGLYVKAGGHLSTASLAIVPWCAYSLYVSAISSVSLFNLDVEWLQPGKWFDNINTVKDSANLLTGNIFYWVVEGSGVGPNPARFSKSGGSNVQCILNGSYLIYNDSKINYNSTSGLLSVGTTTHTDANGNSALRVVGANGTDVISATDATGTANFGLYILSSAVTPVLLGTTTNHPLAFYSNNSAAKMVLTTSGNFTIGGATITEAYRTTNAGSNINAQFVSNTGASISTAGSKAFMFDNTNGFVIAAANGTREIARLAINGTNFTNTAGSEAADMSFYTQNAGAAMVENLRLKANGILAQPGTNTAAGTTGAQTINKPSGSVNFAAGASTLVVTNSLATTTSVITVTVYGTDATAISARVTRASGSFTITLNAAATAETTVGFRLADNY